MSRILIDTNIYSNACRGERATIEILQKVSEIGFSTISIGELLSGFKGGSKELENRAEMEIFLDSPRVRVYCVDGETADFYAEIVHNLRRSGTPIPTNDVWIAAVAFQHGLKLYTKDRHFRYVAGLSCIAF